MFDVQLRRGIDPALNRMATILAKTGVSANALTIIGALLGVAAGVALTTECYLLALLLVIINRIIDGLDGALARVNGPSLWGGYLDSIADYLFYVAVPVGFGLANPDNLVPALLLVASFTLTAVSFLAYAAIAVKAGNAEQGEDAQSPKAFLYSAGMMEGGETVGFFIAMCAFPAHFAPLAMLFSGLCILTVGQRVWISRQQLL